MAQVLNGAEAAQSVLRAGALLHCNTGAWVSLPEPGSGLGAWGLGFGAWAVSQVGRDTYL